jgi:hypothetical protein
MSEKYVCPIFEDETERGEPHYCKGWKGDSLSKLRKHLRANKNPHLPFLQRCEICKHDFIDEGVFKQCHEDGKCNNARPVPKSAAGDLAYELLKEMVLLYVRHNITMSTGNAFMLGMMERANMNCRGIIQSSYKQGRIGQYAGRQPPSFG